jgi:hypothetical protein
LSPDEEPDDPSEDEVFSFDELDESVAVPADSFEVPVDSDDVDGFGSLADEDSLDDEPMEPNTLRSGPPQAGHSVRGSSRKDWTTSTCSPQDVHAYSYVGIRPDPFHRLALSTLECQVYRRSCASVAPTAYMMNPWSRRMSRCTIAA